MRGSPIGTVVVTTPPPGVTNPSGTAGAAAITPHSADACFKACETIGS